MTVRYPLEYKISPRSLEPGRRWVVVNLKHLGAHTLTALDVRLNSLDAYGIRVLGDGAFISVQEAGEEKLLPFQVMATSTAQLYVSVDGWEEEEAFHWETPAVTLRVGEEVADLLSFFVLTQPYLSLRETVKCEATVKALNEVSDLSVEFWAEAPNGAFMQLGDIDVKPLTEGETVRYTTEFTAEEEGLYSVYAYLYDGMRRIGRQTDSVYVS